MGEVMDGRADHLGLLAAVDCCGAVAEITATAHSDFDEYEFIAVVHHKVDFAAACPIISRNETKATADEESLGCTFGAPSEFRRTGFWFRVPQSVKRPAHHDSRLPTLDV